MVLEQLTQDDYNHEGQKIWVLVSERSDDYLPVFLKIIPYSADAFLKVLFDKARDPAFYGTDGELCTEQKDASLSRDLNTGPADYKSAALPTKPLRRHIR